MTAEIWISGEIGFDTTARGVVDQLRATGGGPVDVHIASGGGDCFDGLASFEALRSHPGQVTVYVDALAASAASIVAMAGDVVVMAPAAMIMIHDAAVMTWGDQADHVASADLLGKVSDQLAAIYAARAGGTAASWRELMRAETWFSSSEAVAAGLADRVADAKAAPIVPFARARREVQAGQLAASLREGLRAGLPGHAVRGVVAARLGGPARRPVGRRPVPSALATLRALNAASR